jgi:intracellular sulfur oxidation DsrE/DsrF family protein
MKHLTRRVALPLLVVIACSGAGLTARQSLPVPGVEPARDVPGAKALPDPKATYRVLFDMASAPAKPGDVNPMLQTTARYLNTLAKAGVQADHRKIAVIIHQGATPSILKNEAYKARNGGQDNPNIALVQALTRAGVEFHVCGQAVLGQKIEPSDIQPEIQLDLWALTTIVDMVGKGYVRVGGA